MTKVIYTVPNISCHHCVHTIKSELSELPGVKSVEGRVDTKQVTIEFESPADEQKLKDLLSEIDYPVE